MVLIMEQSSILNILNKNIYFYDKNEFGHAILVMKDILKLKLKNENVDLFINKVSDTIKESLNVSNNYGKKRGYVHVYLTDCALTKLPISMFKKLNTELSNRFDDTVEKIYVYSNNTYLKRAWSLVRMIVDPDTRKKIEMVISRNE